MSTANLYIDGNAYYPYPSSSTDTTSQQNTTNTAGTSTTGWTTNLPNYSGLSSQASNVALSNLQGVVPTDVQNQLSQAAAERGITQGSYGNANTSAELLRALGLTSQNLTTLGEQQYNTLLQNSPRTTTTNTTGSSTGSTSGSTTSDLSFEQASALNSLLATGYGTTAGTNAASGTTAGSHANSAGVSPPITGGGSGSSITQPNATTTFGNAGTGNFGGAGSVVQDPSTGQLWQQNANGQWQNLSTGATSANNPTASTGMGTDTSGYVWDDMFGQYYDPSTGEWVGDTGTGTGTGTGSADWLNQNTTPVDNVSGVPTDAYYNPYGDTYTSDPTAQYYDDATNIGVSDT